MNVLERFFSKEKQIVNATAVVDISSRDFVGQLRAAEKHLQSTQVAKRLADHRVSDFEAAVATIQKKLKVHPLEQPLQDYDQLRSELRIAEERARSAQTAATKAAEEVEGAEIALASIRREIANIPAYARAVEQQRKLWRDAHEISRRAWHSTPVLKLDDDFRAFDALIEQEEKFVRDANEELRAARLPELTARLHDKKGQLLPHHATGTHLPYLADAAAAERAKLV